MGGAKYSKLNPISRMLDWTGYETHRSDTDCSAHCIAVPAPASGVLVCSRDAGSAVRQQSGARGARLVAGRVHWVAVLGRLAGRPFWFYPWLGFAAYEVVATLFWLAFYLENGGRFVTVALATYLGAALWVGGRRSQRLLAAYTVFPHAALTLPLFLVVDDATMLNFAWAGTILSAAAAAVFAVLYWPAPSAVSRGHEN